jgi:hypothetical protein
MLLADDLADGQHVRVSVVENRLELTVTEPGKPPS